MIQCKIFSSYKPDERFNNFIKENNISFDQIKDIKYVPTVGMNRDTVHNIFLLYDDAPTVMFDETLLHNIQQDLYQYAGTLN